ncbi:helix-turn-helix domain-containing protein [Luteimonas salinilitoris]|uniref:Helix-turn-helix domain-containing protein n=1 Tax=Luteimonas salinilitoris TaxID=3237697 RepID=A0ABV4HY37_9GAMM
MVFARLHLSTYEAVLGVPASEIAGRIVALEDLWGDAATRRLRGRRAVAGGLGVSERHLRRVFREAVGVSPKAFAKLTRFHRALTAAREDGGASWATIAAAAGYYDQAHLITEFHAIAGTTPRALLAELQAAG